MMQGILFYSQLYSYITCTYLFLMQCSLSDLCLARCLAVVKTVPCQVLSKLINMPRRTVPGNRRIPKLRIAMQDHNFKLGPTTLNGREGEI